MRYQFTYGGWIRSVQEAPKKWWQLRWCKTCGKRILGEHIRVLDVDNTRFWKTEHTRYYCMEHDPAEQLQRERPNG